MDAAYITSAKSTSQIAKWEYPEVVLLGRSNCGKSSLINALLNQKNIARVSSTPGRTQMINYFELTRAKDQKIIFADLPGWGFHKAGRRMFSEWDTLITEYLKCQNIQDYLILCDVRRKIEDHELKFFKSLSERGNLIVVITKKDKLKSNDLKKAKEHLRETFAKAKIPVGYHVTVSSLKRTGIDELRKLLFRNFD